MFSRIALYKSTFYLLTFYLLKYLYEKFHALIYVKVNAEIFDDPQIRLISRTSCLEIQIHANSKGKVALDDITLYGSNVVQSVTDKTFHDVDVE